MIFYALIMSRLSTHLNTALRHLRSALLSLLCCIVATPLIAEEVPEPPNYRTDNYMAPVPKTLTGATTVDAETLHKKLADGANIALIDVLPLRRKPPDFPPNRLWRTQPRNNIPNSIWLPNVGYGDIAPEFQTYLIENLNRLIHKRKSDKPVELLFYCLADCWMSWNAAKRALELGFRNILWFPGGTDEWEVMGYPLEHSTAVKMPDFIPIEDLKVQ